MKFYGDYDLDSRGLVICDAWSVAECVINNLTSAEI